MSVSTGQRAKGIWGLMVAVGVGGGGVAIALGHLWFGLTFMIVGLVLAELLLLVERRTSRTTGPRSAAEAPKSGLGAATSGDRTLLDGVPSPVIGLDVKGVVLACNR